MGALRELADRTPASRERYIDLLRAVAICAVVLGHWLISFVGYDADGRLTGHSALPVLLTRTAPDAVLAGHDVLAD